MKFAWLAVVGSEYDVDPHEVKSTPYPDQELFSLIVTVWLSTTCPVLPFVALMV